MPSLSNMIGQSSSLYWCCNNPKALTIKKRQHFSEKELRQRGSCVEHNTARWTLWQPCGNASPDRQVVAKLIIYFKYNSKHSIASLLHGLCQTETLNLFSVLQLQRTESVCTVLCTIPCKYTTVKGTKQTIEYFISCMRSVNFHLYFQFYDFHF